jgi:hypothetical protein
VLRLGLRTVATNSTRQYREFEGRCNLAYLVKAAGVVVAAVLAAASDPDPGYHIVAYQRCDYFVA